MYVFIYNYNSFIHDNNVCTSAWKKHCFMNINSWFTCTIKDTLQHTAVCDSEKVFFPGKWGWVKMGWVESVLILFNVQMYCLAKLFTFYS